MMKRIAKISVAMSAAALIAACSGGGGGGPDEFSIIPFKPLEAPENVTELPEPYAAIRNRADQNPKGDSVEALGGNAAALDSQQIRSNEQALLAATGRFGRPDNIREVTAREDEEYRRANRGKLLERWFDVATLPQRYESQLLDPYTELLRLRRLGIRTPTAPPEN